MVSNRKRVEKKVIDAESYKKLVITHIYLLCRSRCLPLKELGADELRAAGARIVKNDFGVRGIEVIMPPDHEMNLRAELLKVHIADNKGFLPEIGKKKKTRFVRGKKRKEGLADAETLDEGLMDSIGSSVGLKDRF